MRADLPEISDNEFTIHTPGMGMRVTGHDMHITIAPGIFNRIVQF